MLSLDEAVLATVDSGEDGWPDGLTCTAGTAVVTGSSLLLPPLPPGAETGFVPRNAERPSRIKHRLTLSAFYSSIPLNLIY